MPRYRLYLLDPSSKASGAALERRCATDREALLLAMDIIEGHAAIEVWTEDRVIGRVTARDAQAMRERMRGREPGLLVNRGIHGWPGDHARSAQW